MGKINTIWNPQNWEINRVGKSKIIESDVIYEMIIGEGDSDGFYNYEIKELISKDNYVNLINGTYSFKVFPYSDMQILIFNDKNRLVPLIKGIEINYDDLDCYQKEYISKLEVLKENDNDETDKIKYAKQRKRSLVK